MTAILVDDEQLAIDRLISLFASFPEIEVLTAMTCPNLAQAEIIRQKPDLLLTDVEMPGMSGFELVKSIKKAGVNTKVVFVTAFDHYAIKAIREAAFDYLTKPVDIDDLKAMIVRMNGDSTNHKNIVGQIGEEFQLTERESEILAMVFKGSTSQEIANRLFLSKHTIDTHRRNLLAKIGLESTKDLMLKYLM
ncbi:MAG: response regulator transcription factor [Bacteroidales bacterium]|nr:response regulator transcription factor [Bacteroidales bacterium]MCF8456937.1 response regulator transcription factor [Bacteroidales bacterium]